MKKLKWILATGLFLLMSLEMSAQSKAEKKLYGKTVESFSVKSADKFLKKYPKSVYAPRIIQMKDSLILAEYLEANTTKLTPEEALGIAGGEALSALGWKKDGVEKVLALDPDLTLRVLSPDGTLLEKRRLPVYTMEEGAPRIDLVIPMEMIAPLGGSQNYIHFGYRNGDREYAEALYLPTEDHIFQALFYGNPLGEGCIEGQCPEMLEGTIPPAEVAWLVGLKQRHGGLAVFRVVHLHLPHGQHHHHDLRVHRHVLRQEDPAALQVDGLLLDGCVLPPEGLPELVHHTAG